MKRDSSQELRLEDKFQLQGHYSRQVAPSPLMYIGKDVKEFQPLKKEYVQSPRAFMSPQIKSNFTSNVISNRQNREGNIASNNYLNRHMLQQQSTNWADHSTNRNHNGDWIAHNDAGMVKYKQSFISGGRIESDSSISEFQHKKVKNIQGSSSYNRLPSVNEESHKLVNSSSTKKLDSNTNMTNMYEYRHLHEKLHTLENKIISMRSNLQKKKEDKKNFLQAQIKDRKERERQIREKGETEKREQEYRIDMKRKEQEELERLNTKKWQKEGQRQYRDENENRNYIQNREYQKPVKKNNDISSSALKGLVTQVSQHKDLRHLDFNPYSPRNNIYYVSEIVKAYKQDKSLVREHLLSSMRLLKTMESTRRPNMFDIAAKNVSLLKKDYYKDKKTVVFDLDETLIHCNESTNVPYDIKVPIKFPSGEVIEAGINIRPYAHEILRNLSANFEVIVFTASHSCYANVVLDHLDPENKYIQHRLFREHCHSTSQGVFVKDLRIINRPLSDLVLIDNAAYSYAFQPENGIPIIPYYEGKHDYELSSLEKYLSSMILSKDVRDVNRKTFKLEQYRNYQDPDQLVKELYSHAN